MGGGWKKRYWQEELVGKLALRGNDIFFVLCGRRDFNEMIEACCRTCEMMKLQRYSGKLR